MTLPSPTTSTSATTDKALSILKFWHSVEFFVPFDLEDVIARALTSTIGQEELLEHGNDTIPWLSTYAKKKIGCEATKTYNYHLYLLPFNKNELTRLSRYYFPQKFSAIKTIEFEERLADEGTTCFAKLPIDSYGRPDFTKLSVSTLPWAMGCIIREELSFLSAHYYAKEQSKLQIALQELAMHIDLTESPLLSDTVAAGILTAQGLTALSTILKKWAGFSPDYPAEWIIVAYEGYQNFRPEEITDENIKRIASNLPAIPIEKIAKVEVNASTEDSAKESTNSDRFDILNSFFIDDLEKVYNYLLNKPQAAILSYINGIAPEQKYDLYTEAYMPYIRDKLQVDYLTVGSWPRSPNQSLSLMQQLAIHEVFHPTNSENLFSVNGPPGTGKTTLLKDIIADIVTQRARILAGFKEVKDTFVRKHSLSFHNNTEVTIRQLAPTLTGYEILVASSNNAAVENISKELPLRKELSKEYQHACHYFAPVAAKLAAYHAKQQVYSLQDKELPWGLISIALGNARNRNLFVDRVFCSPEPKDETTSRIQKGDYLTIWEWSKKYQGPSFNDAKKAFNVANSTLTVFLEKLKLLEQAHLALINIAWPEALNDIAVTAMTSSEKYHRLIEKKHALEAAHLNITEKKVLLLADVQQMQKLKPSLIERILRKENAKQYAQYINQARKKLGAFLLEQTHLEEMSVLVDKQRELYDLLYKKINSLHQELGPTMLPAEFNFLHDEKVQMHSFWHNEKLNALRSELFIASLKLHEAWFVESLRQGHLGGNLNAIFHLLSGRHLAIPHQETWVWQTLFMWIPVVSSTFASISRQFKNINAEILGWLLIDEAGQAVPQSAIGAIWRSKRTIVVGDPQQIEPVFTIPAELVHAIATEQLKQDYAKYLPMQTSIQNLADDANKISAKAYLSQQVEWIGCPLRVHRRCLDPMFSVANSIAYNNKMIHARMSASAANGKSSLLENAWLDIIAPTTDKQYVEVQGLIVTKLFAVFLEHCGQLPDLYIITPFKQVKRNLMRLIRDDKKWELLLRSPLLFTDKELGHWCSSHIGTVHTFQGREAHSVIFVLGVDRQSQGSANWAASKPNLLNVALTRARDNIYVIGDFDLWASKNYFSELAPKLKRIKLTEKNQFFESPVADVHFI